MTDLFFIALLPPKEISDKIIAIQKAMAVKYDSRHALKSPPHITLIPPFKFSSDFEKVITEPLTDFFRQCAPFTIQLNKFSRFERNRVVFINVIKNEHLIETYHELINFVRNNLPIELQHIHEQFTPHLTIASRDLRKEMFREACEEFKEKTFDENFQVYSAFLLRHSGKEWIPVFEFEFKKSSKIKQEEFSGIIS